MVLGSATGNGFEHFFNIETEHVKAIDINPEYCEILEKRFTGKIAGLDVICKDLNNIQLPGLAYDPVHCALIFEYLDVPKLLQKIRSAVNHDGWMTVVLQQPSPNEAPITKTIFKSLGNLSGFMRLIESVEFVKMAAEAGFQVEKEHEIVLESGKKFYVGIFKI